MRALAATAARVDEAVKAKADRYFADQCRRLGPIEGEREQIASRTGRSLDRIAQQGRRA